MPVFAPGLLDEGKVAPAGVLAVMQGGQIELVGIGMELNPHAPKAIVVRVSMELLEDQQARVAALMDDVVVIGGPLGDRKGLGQSATGDNRGLDLWPHGIP